MNYQTLCLCYLSQPLALADKSATSALIIHDMFNLIQLLLVNENLIYCNWCANSPCPIGILVIQWL